MLSLAAFFRGLALTLLTPRHGDCGQGQQAGAQVEQHVIWAERREDERMKHLWQGGTTLPLRRPTLQVSMWALLYKLRGL